MDDANKTPVSSEDVNFEDDGNHQRGPNNTQTSKSLWTKKFEDGSLKIKFLTNQPVELEVDNHTNEIFFTAKPNEIPNVATQYRGDSISSDKNLMISSQRQNDGCLIITSNTVRRVTFRINDDATKVQCNIAAFTGKDENNSNA